MRSPWRNDAVTIVCPVCDHAFHPHGRQRVCSSACRQALWRQRHPTPGPEVPARSPVAQTVYECPTCATRLLGEQRCPDCQVFCRRIGPGAACPHCEEPVAVIDLLPGGSAMPG